MKRKLHAQNSPKAVFLLTFLLILVTFVPFYYFPDYISWLTSPSTTTTPPSSSLPRQAGSPAAVDEQEKPATTTNNNNNSNPTTTGGGSSIIRLLPEECNLFRGDWVPNPRAPYYTNDSCWAIHDHQNCMKYGRPDTAFIRWRWKPQGCDLPVFNPALFLDLVAGKSMAFVGDSIARNQMQSLMCLLSRVTYPMELHKSEDERSTRFFYPKYNFTVANYWTPFLVRAHPSRPNEATSRSFHLHVDEVDPRWATQIAPFDYVVISSGQWYLRPNFFYQKKKLVGCHWCGNASVTDTTLYYGYRHAFRSSFAYLNGLANYTGATFLRTYAPSHFEHGDWNEGGDCTRTSPMRSNETRIEGLNLQMYMTQLEEYRRAEEEGEKRGLRYQLLDVTSAMLLRPDGHPGRYGHPANASVELKKDCVHWCLPGPIDSWNDFLLEIMRRERLKEAAAARAASRKTTKAG